MTEAEPPTRRIPRLQPPSEEATWIAVAILMVLAVVVVLGAEAAGLISR
jgi:hypothetical protein